MASLAVEAALWVLYAGSPFFGYPHKPLLCRLCGAEYPRAYSHFRSAHTIPLNIAAHLVGLVHAAAANAALLAVVDASVFGAGGWEVASAATVLLWCALLLSARGAPLPARAAGCSVLAAAAAARRPLSDGWVLFAWAEAPLFALNVRYGDAKAVPCARRAPAALLLALRCAAQWALLAHARGCLAPYATAVNAVAALAAAVSSVRPFHHAYNCYWAGYLGWALAILVDHPFWFFYGSGFAAPLFQGAAHQQTGEAANLPELAARSGAERAGDEIAHVSFFPVLIFHTTLESLTHTLARGAGRPAREQPAHEMRG